MSYLQGEPSAEKVADIIADAHEDNVPLLMSVVNIDAEWDIAHEAGRFKAKNKMSFADCFAAALALQRKAHLVTDDAEFKQVEPDISVIWL